MTAYTLAAKETVREIRESLSRTIEIASADQLKLDLEMARTWFGRAWVGDDYEAIELWARLAADLAGMIRRRQKEPRP